MTGWTDNNSLVSILILKLISHFPLHQNEGVCAAKAILVRAKFLTMSGQITVYVKTWLSQAFCTFCKVKSF